MPSRGGWDDGDGAEWRARRPLRGQIATRRRDFSVASVERIIAPGPDRRAALPLPAAMWRLRLAASELSRAAAREGRADRRGIGSREHRDSAENLIEAAPAEFGYRSRIRLKVGREGRLGFYLLGSNVLVEIDRCLVASPGLRLPNAFASALWRNLDEIEVVENGEREVITAMMRKPPSSTEVESARQIIEQDPGLQGIILRSGRDREVIGDPAITIDIERGLDLVVDADLFSQVNHAQNRKLVATVMEMAAIERGMRVLDIFCGAGNLSLPAARRGAIVNGIDVDALAVAVATKNAQRLSFMDVNFIAGKAIEAVNFLLRAKYRPEVVILDPPRTGAFELMEAIIKLHPRSIIYVSCDVSTLARDLRVLTDVRLSRASGSRRWIFFRIRIMRRSRRTSY